jgi:isopenicillin N synthase-like dioxygenase|tara:strand:- start:1592 stop:2572 length:981 start_codon:yes stop_codon:yes gene_type:complete
MISNNSFFKEIPVIDISPLVGPQDNPKSLRKTAKEIENACKNIGFFYVKNHQIPQNHLDAVILVMQEFFNLPEEEKMKIHIGNSDVFRGYTPLGKELTNAKYDWHECVDFGLDLEPNHPEVIAGNQLLGPNQWPENQPNFRKALERHWDLMILLGRRITEGLAMSLGFDKKKFARFMNKSHSFMRISNYPPYGKDQEENVGDGIGAHIDYGFLTILLQDNIGGLEVKNADNEWVSAPMIPGTFLINIGHMIQRWTNDYYKATVHRVIPPKHETRCSLPFFFEPNFDAIVVPLDTFCSKNNPPRYKPFHFGNYLESKFTTSYSDTVI